MTGLVGVCVGAAFIVFVLGGLCLLGYFVNQDPDKAKWYKRIGIGLCISSVIGVVSTFIFLLDS
ncbi:MULTISPECIES: hypothetical protein [Bacillus amyloliquefaciens group]|uniref:hypothetical protein n=1 Tax=Bacillus amyloliquefaciens group TaxID=1938374 RepID=UPI00073C387E|nr:MULTISPECIES: hypothetical protein [Bacillus amyloliquefaciens group]KTF59828.1 hypothetical protein AR691_13940 [Bacillus amyloliquefaciens]